ncbi:MAG: preprotein translocase subunit SecE [Burkholderiales bacterium]|nr:preprotein translocase subunit SecE [Burkholderiales bacterium]
MENVDKLKLVVAVLLVAAGITGFYMVPDSHAALRALPMIGGLLLAAAVVWFSAPGKAFVDYARDSIKEAEKVVWPTKKETWQVTGIVFVFAVVLSAFMYVVDSGLTYLIYDVLLKRG